MLSYLMIVSTLCISYLAFGCLALAMFSNFRDIFKQAPTPLQSRSLYWSGWLTLALSYYLSVSEHGMAYGTIFFTGVLSVAGLLVILTLSYRTKFLAIFMVSALVASQGYLIAT
ncbi:DUF3325 domain-containing protein [Shewanella violacea]|uniref:Iron uptake protein n=1 Tax=Shewanella violacea (strain JCM 10179 / CIP 106290 / LMG 19151 / DSS12) TaxID=637905 RepID=D4ZAR5_SHEVD|nr:DUF3325 domain-containing protein [Shewanella violacea]BAJ03110.1 conserved hypothetical protein [Shewanella violacea DSS12]